jgi:hypothetical protein
VIDRIADGWTAYLLTFKFHPISGNPSSVRHQMHDDVERVYSRFVTRVVRNPRSPSSIGSLPILIACADLPVHKHGKRLTPEVTINRGLHYHGLLLVPPRSRLTVTADVHFTDDHDGYVISGKPLADLHVTPVTDDPWYVVDYVMKSVKNRRVSYDDAVLVLPRTSSELASR